MLQKERACGKVRGFLKAQAERLKGSVTVVRESELAENSSLRPKFGPGPDPLKRDRSTN